MSCLIFHQLYLYNVEKVSQLIFHFFCLRSNIIHNQSDNNISFFSNSVGKNSATNSLGFNILLIVSFVDIRLSDGSTSFANVFNASTSIVILFNVDFCFKSSNSYISFPHSQIFIIYELSICRHINFHWFGLIFFNFLRTLSLSERITTFFQNSHCKLNIGKSIALLCIFLNTIQFSINTYCASSLVVFFLFLSKYLIIN